jgi:hypothetical protein
MRRYNQKDKLSDWLPVILTSVLFSNGQVSTSTLILNNVPK